MVSALDTRPLRVGVLGTGRIGSLHAELLAHRVPGAALAAVYDMCLDSSATARRLGREPPALNELLLRFRRKRDRRSG